VAPPRARLCASPDRSGPRAAHRRDDRVADIVGRDDLSTRRSILDLGLRSVLCAPIRSGGRQLGILYVDSRRVGSLLSERDLGLLSAFAALAGSALENARLINDLRRKGDLLAHMATNSARR